MKPNLSYYNLKRASQLLEIEVDDIIHFWLMGELDLQVNFEGVECRLVQYFPNDINLINFYRKMGPDPYKSNDIKSNLRWFTYKEEMDDRGVIGKDNSMRIISHRGLAYGLWLISPIIVTRFVKSKLILSDNDSVQDIKKSGVAYVHGHYVLGNKIKDQLFFDKPISVSLNDLVIDKENVELLEKLINNDNECTALEVQVSTQNDTSIDTQIVAARSSKTDNLQNKFIKSLLRIQYGEDVAQNPRRFIEQADSEINNDFNGLNIKIPAGKTVQTWLDRVEIPFIEE